MRRAADGVEETVIFLHARLAVAVAHGGHDALLHFLGLAAHHGGLVCDTDAAEMFVGIKARAVRAFEAPQECPAVAAFADVVADEIGVIEREDDEVMALALVDGATRGRARLLVRGLAVDDARHVFGGVLLHAFPDAHHVAARRVHDLNAAFFQPRERGHAGAECGDDHDVLRADVVHVCLALAVQNIHHAHVGDLPVHLGVVDDFAEDEDALVRKNFPRRVREIDGALDAVAEAELLREMHGHAVHRERAAGGADALDDFAAVVRLDLRLHGGHDVGGAEVRAFGGHWRGGGGHWSGSVAAVLKKERRPQLTSRTPLKKRGRK